MSESTPGSTGGQSRLGRFIDHRETYGPQVVAEMIKTVAQPRVIVDLGAGSGRDLTIASSIWPNARLVAIESYPPNVAALASQGVEVYGGDIERDLIPLGDASVDLVIANQVLEHTKDVFWIFHEVSRVLRPGGSVIFGTPNLLALHNRLLMLVGRHATQHKLVSAHVRPFSKHDVTLFFDTCFPDGYELIRFAGSQFYPLPASAARVAARIAPSLAFSIFFHFRKIGTYEGQFLHHPVAAKLETNFYLGPRSAA